jgi:hypothetical protein
VHEPDSTRRRGQNSTDSFGPWRSCAARRVQMAVLVAQSVV